MVLATTHAIHSRLPITDTGPMRAGTMGFFNLFIKLVNFILAGTGTLLGIIPLAVGLVGLVAFPLAPVLRRYFGSGSARYYAVPTVVMLLGLTVRLINHFCFDLPWEGSLDENDHYDNLSLLDIALGTFPMVVGFVHAGVLFYRKQATAQSLETERACER